MALKAYKTWIAGEENLGSVVVFAETAGQAKNLGRDFLDCDFFVDVRVIRVKELDGAYSGHCALDWYQPDDRRALVSVGWTCDPYLFDEANCSECNCTDICEAYKEAHNGKQ